jgi:hypothetical protein
LLHEIPRFSPSTTRNALHLRPSFGAMRQFKIVWSTVGRVMVLLHASAGSQMHDSLRRKFRAWRPAKRRPIPRRCGRRYSDLRRRAASTQIFWFQRGRSAPKDARGSSLDIPAASVAPGSEGEVRQFNSRISYFFPRSSSQRTLPVRTSKQFTAPPPPNM